MERAALATRRRGSAARCHEKRLGSGGVIAGSERNESVKNNSRKSADLRAGAEAVTGRQRETVSAGDALMRLGLTIATKTESGF